MPPATFSLPLHRRKHEKPSDGIYRYPHPPVRPSLRTGHRPSRRPGPRSRCPPDVPAQRRQRLPACPESPRSPLSGVLPQHGRRTSHQHHCRQPRPRTGLRRATTRPRRLHRHRRNRHGPLLGHHLPGRTTGGLRRPNCPWPYGTTCPFRSTAGKRSPPPSTCWQPFPVYGA